MKGRILDFPNNTGIDGGTLRVYRLDSETGQRAKEQPVYEKVIDETGDFGRLDVNGKRHYEFEVSQPGAVHDPQLPRAIRAADHFYRVLWRRSSPLHRAERGSRLIAVTHKRESGATRIHTPDANDKLKFNGFNVINEATAPRVRRVLAVFNFDNNSDGVSDTSVSQPPFGSIAFLTGIDNYMPASADASGTIAVKSEDARSPSPGANDERPGLALRPSHRLGVLQGLRREGLQEVRRR